MHLSFLSSGYLSDSINDSADPIFAAGSTRSDAHLQGLIRGLVFAAALACPLALASASAWLHRADLAGALEAPSFLTTAAVPRG